METGTNNFLIFLFILLNIYLVVKLFNGLNDNVYIKSNIDNKSYLVRNTTNNKNQVADQLATLNFRITTLIDIVNKKYSNNYDYFFVKYLKRYNVANISEASIDKRYTTYTVNKEDLYVCLRTRDSNENLYDINLLMYVILHELAHFCNFDKNGNPIEGHGIEFQQKFIFLGKEAIANGLYYYENYSVSPKEYCGLSVNSSILT